MSDAVRPTRLTRHIAGLDGVRGLAILMVMALHFIGHATAHTMGQRLAVKAASYGILGVDLFFVLSGFLITGLLVDAKGRPHYFRNFYARRTLRIFPLYYLVLALLFLVLPLAMTLPRDLELAREHQAWLWTYTANFFIAAKSSWYVLTYVSHFWSLAVEEHFYLLWPLVVFSFRRELLERVCVGVLVFGLVLRIILALAGMSELSISVLTPCRVDSLCAGALPALVARREGGADMLVRRSRPAALTLGALLLGISAWCAMAKVGLPVLHQVRGSLFALFFAALSLMSIATAPSTVAKVFQSRVLRFFGTYSYGLYVYHGIFTWYLLDGRWEDRLDASFGSHSLTIAFKALVGASASVLVAIASYHLFEKRFLALKRFFGGPEAPENRALSVTPVDVRLDRGRFRAP